MDQIDAAEIKLFTRAANDPSVFTITVESPF